MSQWQRPEIVVASIRSDGPINLVGLRLPSGLTPPLAPASLWADDRCLVDLDSVVGTDGDTTIFRTSTDVPGDLVGQTLGFQQWWTPDQPALVTETWRAWTRVPEAPANAPDFCRLGWEPTETDIGPATGWVSGSDWICERCHETYVVRDRLGVRN